MSAQLIPWWILCLISSFLFAAYLWVNAHFKVSPLPLIFWRSFFCLLLLSPFVPFLTFPEEWSFYALTVLAALTGFFFDVRIYQTTARFGGALAARVMPLRILIVFAFWSLLVPSSFFELFEESWRGYGVILSLGAATIALMSLQHCHVSWSALLLLFPGLIALSVSDIFAKQAVMLGSHPYSTFVVFTMVLCVVMLIASFLYMQWDKTTPALKTKPVVIAGITAGIIYAAQLFTKAAALQATPNPGYFAAIGMLGAFWLHILNRIQGIREESDVRAGAMLIASIICLVLLVT